MSLRPRAVITTPYPSPAATARVLGVSPKRYRELRAMVTEYLAPRQRSRSCAAPEGTTPQAQHQESDCRGAARSTPKLTDR